MRESTIMPREREINTAHSNQDCNGNKLAVAPAQESTHFPLLLQNQLAVFPTPFFKVAQSHQLVLFLQP